VAGADVFEGVPGLDAPKLEKLKVGAPPTPKDCGVLLAVPNKVFPGPEVVVFAPAPNGLAAALLAGVDEPPKLKPVLP
jgi:hypothetical protein